MELDSNERLWIYRRDLLFGDSLKSARDLDEKKK